MTTTLKLADIDTQTVGWSCKVRVIKKNEPKESIGTPGKKYMFLILEDENGTRVQAIVFDHDIGMYDLTLKTNYWYNISNATVRPPRPNYKVLDEKYKYTWTLTGRTVVQSIENDDVVPLSPMEQVYTPFSEFYQCMKTSKEISIVAIVIDKLPKEFISATNRTQKVYDIIVADEQIKPIVLTIWGGFVDKEGTAILQEIEAENYPVLSLDYIAVVHYKGISLSTRSHSIITINPEGPRAEDLKEWAIQNKDMLDALKSARDYNNAAINLANPEAEEIAQIATVPPFIDQTQPAWIKGKINFKLDNKNNWYIGCSHCLKKVYAQTGKQFNCMHCGQINAVGTPRCKMEVEITDESGSVEASVFGICAEKLLSLTSKQVMEMEQQGKKIAFQDINKRLQDTYYIVQLQTQSYKHQGKTIASYSVTSVHDSELYATTNNSNVNKTLSAKKKVDFQ